MTVSMAGYPRALAPLGVLKALVAAMLAVKAVLLVSAGVFQDEAYCWLWGQHPALSYYDHPPLNAWLQGIAGALFGWNRFALRIMVALALVADIWLIWLICGQPFCGGSVVGRTRGFSPARRAAERSCF